MRRHLTHPPHLKRVQSGPPFAARCCSCGGALSYPRDAIFYDPAGDPFNSWYCQGCAGSHPRAPQHSLEVLLCGM
ncbi:hypothetical protein [Caudoviricetes sp.]|nr:hypothetical protein [Caudoviricetes sp.]